MACFISSTTSFCYATPIRAPSASSSASDGFRFGFRIKINSRPFPSSSKRTFRPQHVYDPYRKIDLPSLEEFYNDEGMSDVLTQSPPPPKLNRINIAINNEIIRNLDLSPAHAVLRAYTHQSGDKTTQSSQDPTELLEQTVGFIIDYVREDPYDAREFSEMSDVRLWFIRLDAAYPWLPIVLDCEAGEVARYAAMLVPHQISRRLGIVFNPDGLELFVMKKLFIIDTWLGLHKVADAEGKMKCMLAALGFKVDSNFFQLLKTH